MADKVIILDGDYKFVWNKSEIKEIKKLWENGCFPSEIAKAMNEDVENIWLALNHLYLKGKISFDRCN